MGQAIVTTNRIRHGVAFAALAEYDGAGGGEPEIRILCQETGDSVPIPSRHPRDLVFGMRDLNESCSCNAMWHLIKHPQRGQGRKEGIPMAAGPETIRIEEMSPQRAAKILEKNNANRRVREILVQEIERAIAAGHWYLTGDTIKLASDGSVIDGQHRLLAIVRSGKAVRVAIARGIDKGAQVAVDRGRSRTLGDDLRMAGHVNYNTLAATCALRMRWDAGGRSGASFNVSRATYDDAKEIIKRVPHIERSVAMCTDRRLTKLVGGSVAAMCHSVWYELDKQAADVVIEDMASGVGLRVRDPILALRERLIESRASRVTFRKGDVIAMMMRSWNARIEGRDVSRVYRYAGRGPNRGDATIPNPISGRGKQRSLQLGDARA